MPPGNLPTKETSKQRSLRIELLYLRRGHAWYRSKYAWSLVALLIAAAYVVWLGVGGEPAAAQLSPGPLASPHAALNTRCADCHTAYVSTSPRGEGVNLASQTLLGMKAHPRISDTNCTKCHQTQSQLHHSKQLEAEVASCATCHADHEGSRANLARPGDKVCTICHEGIGLHRQGGKSDYEPPLDNVAFFGRAGDAKPNHPNFRSVPAKDVNNFKFNHQLHLLPGQWARGGDMKNAWTPDKLLAEFRGKYDTVPAEFEETVDGQKQKRTIDVVQLKCESCHVPQEGDPSAHSGAYMLPIRYEQHCKACHALDLQLMESVAQPAPAGITEPPLLLPHGLNKREIDEFVSGISAKLKSGDKPRERYPVRIPGKTPAETSKDAEPASADTQNSVANRLEEWRPKIQEVMCGKCHKTEATITPGSSDDLFKNAVGFARPKIPQRWLKHGEFDHRAHLAWAKCEECHVGTESPKDFLAKPVLDDENVLIPQIGKCAECHAPVNPHINKNSWARFDCVECHRYHPQAGAP